MGFITDEQQELLVDEQHEHPGQLLGKVAIDMGLIDEEKLAQALAGSSAVTLVFAGSSGMPGPMVVARDAFRT